MSKLDKNDVPRLKSMKDLPFHFGLKMECYPSYQQKSIINFNGNTSRWYYNHFVAANQGNYYWYKYQCEMIIHHLQKRMYLCLPFENNYFSTICYLPLRFSWVGYQQVQTSFTDKQLRSVYTWLDDNRHDSLLPKMTRTNFKSALHMMKEVNHHVPSFHRKCYAVAYQTACLYAGMRRNKKHKIVSYGAPTDLVHGSVRFIGNHYLRLPKIGRIKVKGSQQRILDLAKRQLIRIGTVTIHRTSDNRYFVSLSLGSDKLFVNFYKQLHHRIENMKVIGIDLNTSNFLTSSNGNVIDNPKFYKRSLKKLKKLQRALSRKQRHAKREQRSLRTSKNYQQNRIAFAKLQRHVKNQRSAFLHKISSNLIKNHDLVVAENLKSKNMLRNHALAQSISDIGWRELLSQLQYKGLLYHTYVKLVNPRYTTQVCSKCGFRNGTRHTHKLELKDRTWTCSNCGYNHIRDYNAACNILYEGLNDLINDSNLSNQLKVAKEQYLMKHLKATNYWFDLIGDNSR